MITCSNCKHLAEVHFFSKDIYGNTKIKCKSCNFKGCGATQRNNRALYSKLDRKRKPAMYQEYRRREEQRKRALYILRDKHPDEYNLIVLQLIAEEAACQEGTAQQ